MVEKNEELDRLCILYETLKDSDKGKIILMTEGLLRSQKVIKDENKVYIIEEKGKSD